MRAPLANPYAMSQPGDEASPPVFSAVDWSLRTIAHALLRPADTSNTDRGHPPVLSIDERQLLLSEKFPRTEVSACLTYLRDRVGVPRDMSLPSPFSNLTLPYPNPTLGVCLSDLSTGPRGRAQRHVRARRPTVSLSHQLVYGPSKTVEWARQIPDSCALTSTGVWTRWKSYRLNNSRTYIHLAYTKNFTCLNPANYNYYKNKRILYTMCMFAGDSWPNSNNGCGRHKQRIFPRWSKWSPQLRGSDLRGPPKVLGELVVVVAAVGDALHEGPQTVELGLGKDGKVEKWKAVTLRLEA